VYENTSNGISKFKIKNNH